MSPVIKAANVCELLISMKLRQSGRIFFLEEIHVFYFLLSFFFHVMVKLCSILLAKHFWQPSFWQWIISPWNFLDKLTGNGLPVMIK